MFVQATDGKFYLNAKFEGDNFVIRFEGKAELRYKTRRKDGVTSDLVRWETARKVLKPAGIVAGRGDAGGYVDMDLLNGVLYPVTAYEIKLTKPIPVPITFDLCVADRPQSETFEVLAFETEKPKKKRKAKANVSG